MKERVVPWYCRSALERGDLRTACFRFLSSVPFSLVSLVTVSKTGNVSSSPATSVSVSHSFEELLSVCFHRCSFFYFVFVFECESRAIDESLIRMIR